MKSIGYFTISVFAIVIGSLWYGYAFSILWGWFIVPIFHTPTLSLPAAIGVSLVVGYLTHQIIPEDKSLTATERLAKSCSELALKPAVTLGMGYAIKCCL